MSEIVEGSVLDLQESEESERKARKLSDLLKEEGESEDMDAIIERRRRSSTRGKWRNLKERLGFKGGIGCCGGGGAWGFSNATSDMTVREEEEEEEEEEDGEEDLQRVSVGQIPITENSAEDDDADRGNLPNVGQISVVSGDSRMNLATALAAERHIRAAHELERDGPTDMILASSTPLIRVSLMRLLEEGDGVDVKERRGRRRRREEEDGGENDWVCCVCMERRKGAAFIPCGHTFCRCCSRDLWLNRGSCPICNHSILEILDIF